MLFSAKTWEIGLVMKKLNEWIENKLFSWPLTASCYRSQTNLHTHRQIATRISRSLPWQKCSKGHVSKDSQLRVVTDDLSVFPVLEQNTFSPLISMYAFRDWSTHLHIHVLHIFKSDYAHTHSWLAHTLILKTHLQIPVHMHKSQYAFRDYFTQFTNLITHTQIEIQ